jgi:hypothetical protein
VLGYWKLPVPVLSSTMLWLYHFWLEVLDVLPFGFWQVLSPVHLISSDVALWS